MTEKLFTGTLNKNQNKNKITSKIRNFKPLATFMIVQPGKFVWDLVGNPEDRFFHNEAQMTIKQLCPNLNQICMTKQQNSKADSDLSL